MSDPYAAYERLKFDRPAERVLRITMDAPGRLNAADARMHDELARVWKDVEADPGVSVAILRGAGEAFSAGGHFDMIEDIIDSFETRARVWKEACEPVSGEEAERIGLVSLCVEDDALQDIAVKVAEKLARGAPSAIRFTKYALNNWLRMMGPTFDTSLALEFLGFTGPEAREGLASLKEKRRPAFDPKSGL